MTRMEKFKKILSITLLYFKSSLKTTSGWMLIIFNIFILISLYLGGISIEETILSYLVQSTMIVILFGITILFLRQFISVKKVMSGKGILMGTSIFAIFIWIFYGIALSMLFIPILNNVKIGLNCFIGLVLLILQSFIFFFLNFKKERKRLENADLTKSFFEPAGNIFPAYISIIFMITGQIWIIIIVKTLADIIISSPLNVDEPYIYNILAELNDYKIA